MDPHNAPNFISSIIRIISGPDGAPKVGETWKAEANFLGQKRFVNLRLDSLSVDNAVRFVLEGDPEALLSLRLSPAERSSQTSVSLTLDVPSVPGILLNALLGGMLGEDLVRLKANLEGASRRT